MAVRGKEGRRADRADFEVLIQHTRDRTTWVNFVNSCVYHGHGAPSGLSHWPLCTANYLKCENMCMIRYHYHLKHPFST